MAWLLLIVYVLNAMVERAQTSLIEDHLLCNSTIANANASGVFPLTVNFPPKQGSGLHTIPDPAWAVTVVESQGKTESTLWYSPAGQNYTNDLALGYDACAQIAYGLPANTIRLAQDDPGDCSKTLTTACRNAIITRLQSTAYELTEYPSPPPHSNLTAGEPLCEAILNGMNDNDAGYPVECNGQIGGGSVEPVQLTGFNTSVIYYGTCTLDGTAAEPGKFYNVSTLASDQADAYDVYTRGLQIVVSVFFDVANVNRTSAGHPASAQLRCIRPKSFAKGSVVSPPLPSGTPYTNLNGNGNGLSKGAIAGIVVGVVVFVAVVAVVAWWVWRRKRKGGDRLAARKAREVDDAGSYELHRRYRGYEANRDANQ